MTELPEFLLEEFADCFDAGYRAGSGGVNPPSNPFRDRAEWERAIRGLTPQEVADLREHDPRWSAWWRS